MTMETMTEPPPPPSNNVIESALATLQPIRDLSRNWDVDIASCLEEYLQDLIGLSGSQLQLSSNSSETPADGIPNFAQAAIILQNSSHVYSRKVEYLHGLVYKALYEFFKSTGGASNAKESRRKSADPSIDDFYDFDPNEDFLLLDDVLPEDHTNTKINLKEDDEDENRRDSLASSGTPLNQSMTRTRLSLGGLSVTRVERSSIGSIASSSQQRALLGTLNSGSLRLVDGLCDVGEDGVLLMPGSQSSQVPTGGIVESHPAEGGRSLFGDGPAAPVDGAAGHGNDDLDDHSNDGPGFAMFDDGDDNDDGDNAGGFDGNADERNTEVGVVQNAAQVPPKRVTFADTDITTRPKRMDPWALLDPHSAGGTTPKQLRKGKTYRLPEGITMPPSECVTGASTRRAAARRKVPAKEEAHSSSLALETLYALLGKRDALPRIPIDGLAFGDEFLYLAKETAKRKSAERRAERKKRMEEQTGAPASAMYDDDDNDDDDYGGGFAFGGDDNDDDDENNDMGNAGMASLDEAYETSRQDGESNLGKTFEDLCRAHIQAFAKGAEDFAFNTKLSDRVSQWQAKLAPILEEEERRAEFDIHKYSENLLESAQQGLQRIKRKSDGSEHAATRTVDFESVTKNCSQSDVCRLFLASLSLANAGNIQIKEGASGYCFDLVSVNVERPMETYRAPSVADQA